MQPQRSLSTRTTCTPRAAPTQQPAFRSQFVAPHGAHSIEYQAPQAAKQPAHAPRRVMRASVQCAASTAAGEAPTKMSDNGLPRTAVVGVLGGGQLGKMLGQEAVSGSSALELPDLQLWRSALYFD